MKRFLILISIFIIVSSNVNASPLEKIEAYFNNMTTFEADFRQFTVNIGGVSEGKFYINRPRQFLWQYNYPYKQKIVSTGTGAYFYDEENEQVTQIPVNSGFASIFTKNKVSFNIKGLKVTKQVEKDNILEITLKPNEDNIQEITFIMLKKPNGKIQLNQIASKDNFGDTTIVVFNNIEEGEKLDKELFKFVPPQYADED